MQNGSAANIWSDAMNSMNFIDKYILLVYCIVEIYLVYTFFECFFEKKSWALEPKKLYLTNAGAVFSLYAVNLVGKHNRSPWRQKQ